MTKPQELLLSCDWGTSSFRLRLVRIATETVVAEESNSVGIATLYGQWQKQPQQERLSFYLAFLQQQITLLEQKIRISLRHFPLILSGMASSTIGLVELRYKELPFSLEGTNLTVKKLNASPDFPHAVYLISGVKTDSDVMRGEETQLIGGVAEGLESTEQLVVLPGTHSKHVLLKDNEVVSFHTYMTGEFFELLSQKSVLSVSLEKGGELQQGKNRQGFEKGITDSGQFSILHACFRVRTNQILGKLSKRQNFYYLSGLLIGAELRDLMQKAHFPITIIGNGLLVPMYTEAFRLLLPGKAIRTVNATEATIKGHLKIYTHLQTKE